MDRGGSCTRRAGADCRRDAVSRLRDMGAKPHGQNGLGEGVSGNGCGNDGRAVVTSGHRERQGVKGQAVQAKALAKEAVVFAFSILDIANQRTRNVLEVSPYLMKAPTDRGCFDEGVSVPMAEGSHESGRGLLGAVRSIGQRVFDG